MCVQEVCELLPFPIPLCVCVQYRPFFLFDVPPLVVCVCRCPLFLLDDTLASHTLAFYLCVRFKVCPCVCDSRPPPIPLLPTLAPPYMCSNSIVVINNNVFVFVSSSFTPKKKKKTCWLYVGAVYFEEQGVLFYVYTRRNIIYFHRCVYLFFIIYF